MADESHPPPVQKQPSVDTYKWSNRKEDYKLLDVIGEQCDDMCSISGSQREGGREGERERERRREGRREGGRRKEGEKRDATPERMVVDDEAKDPKAVSYTSFMHIQHVCTCTYTQCTYNMYSTYTCLFFLY